MDAFKNYILPDDMPFARVMAVLPKTNVVLIACAVFAIVVCVVGSTSKKNMNPRNPSSSILGGLMIACIFCSHTDEAAIKDIFGINLYQLWFLSSCAISFIIFFMIVSLSVWFQIIETCAIVIAWAVGTMLLLYTADVSGEWGMWAWRIVVKSFSGMIGKEW